MMPKRAKRVTHSDIQFVSRCIVAQIVALLFELKRVSDLISSRVQTGDFSIFAGGHVKHILIRPVNNPLRLIEVRERRYGFPSFQIQDFYCVVVFRGQK